MGELTHTVSGNVASFRSADKAGIKSVKAYFSPVQEGTGDPSPSNIRSITGNTGLTISACGKNLFDESAKESGYINASGTVMPDKSSYHSKLIKVESGKTYTFSGHAPGTATGTGNKRFHGYNENGEWVTQLSYESVSAQTEKWYAVSATIPNNVKYVAISYLVNDQSVMVAKESSRSTYEPYSVRVFPVDWATEAGTVYGGYIDLVSGSLMATHAMRTFNGSEEWEKDGIRYYTLITDAWTPEKYVRTPILSNMGKYGTSSDDYTIFAYEVDAGQRIYYYPSSSVSTLEEYTAWLTEHNLQVSYALSTPVLVGTLTPTQLRTFLDHNNIWNTAGKTEVEYAFTDRLLKKRMMMQVPEYKLSYVRDGLVFHLDGIDKGSDNTKWTDLIGNKEITLTNCIFTANGVDFSTTGAIGLLDGTSVGVTPSAGTIEICASAASNMKVMNCCYFRGENSAIRVFEAGSGSKFDMSNTTTDVSFTHNISTFYAMTLSLNQLRGYVNGNAMTATTGRTWTTSITTPCIILASSNKTSANRFSGIIHSIRIYNRQLTETEILQNQKVDNSRFSLGLTIT